MKQSVRAVKQSPCGVRVPSTDIHIVQVLLGEGFQLTAVSLY